MTSRRRLRPGTRVMALHRMPRAAQPHLGTFWVGQVLPRGEWAWLRPGRGEVVVQWPFGRIPEPAVSLVRVTARIARMSERELVERFLGPGAVARYDREVASWPPRRERRAA